MSNWQDERDKQAKFGNTLPTTNKIQFQATGSLTTRNSKRVLPVNDAVKEIGYMNFIRTLQDQKQEIVVIKADGEVIRGFIKAADAETISLTCPLNGARYRTRVLFKHQIAEFSPTKGIEDLIDGLMSNSPRKI